MLSFLFRLHIRTILRFAQSYNPEIGLHNPKYRAVHLDNPEGKRQLLWRSLFEARTWFLILRILKGRNHSNLLCRLSQVKNKLGSMWPFFGQQMDLLGKLSTKNKSRSYGHCPHLPLPLPPPPPRHLRTLMGVFSEKPRRTITKMFQSR